MKEKTLSFLNENIYINEEAAIDIGINNLADNIYKLRKEGNKIAKVFLRYTKNDKDIIQSYYELLK